jgi:hypothetical protein
MGAVEIAPEREENNQRDRDRLEKSLKRQEKAVAKPA